MPAAWIGVGCVYPSSSTTASSAGESDSDSKVSCTRVERRFGRPLGRQPWLPRIDASTCFDLNCGRTRSAPLDPISCGQGDPEVAFSGS